MSIKLFPLIWGMTPGFLNGVEKSILLKLADCAHEDGSSVYPGLLRVSTETGFCLTAVQKAIRSLLDKKVIELVKAFTARKPNIYKINVDFLEKLNEKKEDIKLCQGSASHQSNSSRVVPNTTQDGAPQHSRLVSDTTQGSVSHQSNSSWVVPNTTQGSASHHSRVVRDTTNPLYNPLIEPLTLLRVPENFRQIDAVVANAPLPLPSEGACVFGEEKNSLGVPSCETDSAEKPKQPPSGGLELHRGTLSKTDSLKNSQLGISLEEDREYDHFLENISADEVPPPVCTEQAFYDSLEALRASASRDWDRDDNPSGKPILETPSKTAIFTAFESLPLQSIVSEQKTAVDPLRTSAIDMSTSGRETENSLPSPKRKKSSKPSPEILDQRFADWYAVYPRKESRKKAFQYFKTALKIMDFERLLELTKLFALSCEGKKKEFIPHPATWLHQERWEDVDASEQPKTASASSSNTQQAPTLDPSLQAFIDSHPKLGTNAFAFSACKVIQEHNRVILQASSQFYLDKVDLYQAELERHYGKRVELTLASRETPRDEDWEGKADRHQPQVLETPASIPDSISQSIPQKEYDQEDITKDVRIPCRRLGRPVYQLAIKNIIQELAFAKAPPQRLAIQGVAA